MPNNEFWLPTFYTFQKQSAQLYLRTTLELAYHCRSTSLEIFSPQFSTEPSHNGTMRESVTSIQQTRVSFRTLALQPYTDLRAQEQPSSGQASCAYQARHGAAPLETEPRSIGQMASRQQET